MMQKRNNKMKTLSNKLLISIFISILFVIFFSSFTLSLASDFVSQWDTRFTSSGSSNASNLTLPLVNGGTYDFTINWGDGSANDTITTWNDVKKQHSYGLGGAYNITINGTINGFRFANTGDRLKIVNISQWGNLRLGNANGYFNGASNLNITATDILNLTGTTTMQNAFLTCKNLTLIPSANNWNTSGITNMASMFQDSSSFNQNISNWETNNVTTMNSMFYGASKFNQSLPNWNTSSVTNMYFMFATASKFNGNISNWDTHNVTDMSSMFNSASEFDQPIGNWNVSKVTDMSNTFLNAGIFNQNLSNWDTHSVTTMYRTFFQNYLFNGNVSNWNTSNVQTMAQMFYANNVFNQSLENWDTKNVTTMVSMFYRCYAFNHPIGNWNTSKLTTTNDMFESATMFNQNLTNWDTHNITDMSYMFYGATRFDGNISNWDTRSVKNLAYMFTSDTAFNQTINNWNTSKVTSMAGMFQSSTAFNQNISAWNTSNVQSMASMFQSSLFNQPVGNWDTHNVTAMNRMFYDNAVFNQNIGNWNISKVTTMSQMFEGGTLSTNNYDLLLNGWGGLANLTKSVTFGAGSSTYCKGETSRNTTLIGTYTWTLTDGGKNSTCDQTAPSAVLDTTYNTTYINNGASINLTANLTDVGRGIRNATLYVYNESGLYLYNQTTSSEYSAGVLSTRIGIVVNLVEGIYNWFYDLFDWGDNQYTTGNNTLVMETVLPSPIFVNPTPINNSGKGGVFNINVSITELNLANITFAFTGQTNIICNRTSSSLNNPFSCNNENASVFNITNTNYVFLFNKSGLTAGNSYYYNLTAYDFANNLNLTETRIVKGNLAPTFITITNTPTSLAILDPGVVVNISVNVSDGEWNLDSVIFQWRNSSSDWGAGTIGSVNITMTNLSIMPTLSNQLTYTLFNASFTTPSYEDTIYYRIWANDTIGEASNSSTYIINNSWDCTWIYSTTIGSTAGWDINKEIGNITINNTGDSQYSNSNCQLQFKLTHTLTASTPSNSRIFFDNNWWKPSDTYTLSAKQNVTIKVNASFLTEVTQETPKISIDEISSRSNDSEENVTATLVSNQIGPYLYQDISSYPLTVSLKSGNSFSLEGYIRNLMGDDTFNDNNTAYNVSFNWTIPTGMTNNSGNLKLSFTNISNNSITYNNLNVTFSSLASVTYGSQIIYLYTQGYNLTGDKIKNANNQTLLTDSVTINFECYNISDGVIVTSCGSLDGDYVATTTTTTTTTSSSSGGGGGSSSPKEYVKSSADFQLVRGLENEIKITYKNIAPNDSLKDLKINLNSDIGKYLEVFPKTLSNLAPGQEVEITIKINSPTYIKLGQHKINLLIEAQKGGLQYSETKVLTVEIHQISSENANELMNKTIELVEKLKEVNLTSDSIQKLLDETLKGMETFDYETLIENNKEIEKQVNYALDSLKIVDELDELVKLSEEKGISVSASKRMIKLARLSLERREFELAYSRSKDAQITYALEIKGELGKLSFYLKAYPKEILSGLFFLGIFSFGTYRLTRLQKIKNKIKKLKEEEEILKELIQVVQKECFEDKKMSMEEYQTAIDQYQKKLSKVIENLIELENKRLHALKFTSATKQMENERVNITQLIKGLQRDYLDNKKIDERVYRIKLESYTKRVSDIDEKMAELESKKAFRENNGFIEKIKRLFRK